MRLSLSQIAAAVGGRLIGPDAPVTGPVVTDSRQAAEGSLFVAVHGERTDGHAHLGSARALGAVGAIVSDLEAARSGLSQGEAEEASIGLVLVEDTVAALGALARTHLEALRQAAAEQGERLTVVAMTGSGGKTTTKDLTRQPPAAPPPTAALAGAHNIPGRMQRISQRDGRRGLCIVDFAHTPDAMELALKAVRPITPGRLIVVFGSDGDRDQGKRPMLGEVCARLADVLVITDENPRSEDPQLIRNAILDGVRTVRPDLEDVEEVTTWRGDAVRRGVELCGPDDTVIVTGKGHEPFLEMAGEFIRYNDAPVMAEAVEEKWGRG